MNSDLNGRVAIVTGAGQGLGREHALHLSRLGAHVVVNDMSTRVDDVAADLGEAGGSAIAIRGDISTAETAQNLIETAVERLGRLDIIVNNAGIVRDRMLVNMSDEEWDDVVRVHLRGHFMLIRESARHWRSRSQSGEEVKASIINTTSGSGLWGNLGQANYGAAKSGIVGLTLVAARELARYGVRVNAIAPNARTPMTLATPAFAEAFAAPAAEGAFDFYDPANISPLVGWLASAECVATGQVYEIQGGSIRLLSPWPTIRDASVSHRWAPEELDSALRGWPSEIVRLGGDREAR